MLDYDSILASLRITFNAELHELRMVAGWTFRDAGMDPIIVVIYDRDLQWTGEGHRKEWERVERRMVTVQGNKALSNSIIDYMEGY